MYAIRYVWCFAWITNYSLDCRSVQWAVCAERLLGQDLRSLLWAVCAEYALGPWWLLNIEELLLRLLKEDFCILEVLASYFTIKSKRPLTWFQFQRFYWFFFFYSWHSAEFSTDCTLWNSFVIIFSSPETDISFLSLHSHVLLHSLYTGDTFVTWRAWWHVFTGNRNCCGVTCTDVEEYKDPSVWFEVSSTLQRGTHSQYCLGSQEPVTRQPRGLE